jgi:hypothetical protein
MKRTKKDFDYVLKVLNSCENQKHLEVTEKLFDNFKIKWEKKLYDLDYVTILYTFDWEYKKKKNSL